MAATTGFELCRLGDAQYADILALWQEAGLHIRPDGRDGFAAFARQLATGYQNVLGLRISTPAGSELRAERAARPVGPVRIRCER